MSTTPTGPRSGEKSGLFGNYKIAAGLFTLLVLVQAVLAGRGWFIDFDLIDIHGMIGSLTFLVGVAMVALVWFGMEKGSSERTTLLIMSGILVILTTAQLGLGYSATSKDNPSAEAASLHIPLGVLIFGLSSAICARVFNGKR